MMNTAEATAEVNRYRAKYATFTPAERWSELLRLNESRSGFDRHGTERWPMTDIDRYLTDEIHHALQRLQVERGGWSLIGPDDVLRRVLPTILARHRADVLTEVEAFLREWAWALSAEGPAANPLGHSIGVTLGHLAGLVATDRLADEAVAE